tara:strand:- start:256 stop:975 length:720 start_codon:yes stop_codon:yes gene_type:complete
MKKTFIIIIFLLANTIYSQTKVTTDEHWSAYAISVQPQNEETVFNIIDEYFSEHKLDDIRVMLFSILFADQSMVEATHEIVFVGNSDSMSKFYSPMNFTTEWNLFSSKISNFIDKTVWALNGRGLASTGPDPTEVLYPYEQILNWGPERDIQKFRKAWVELNKKHERTDRSAVIFTITSSADHKCGVVLRYPSYKAMLTSNAEYVKNNPSWQKDWQTYLKENGGGQITRNFSRILLKEW